MKYIKLLSLTVLMLFAVNNILAQQDTLWYNNQWKSVSKAEANFFRPPIKKEGEFYKVQDYFISGKLQMNAISKYPDKDFWHGKVTWYNEDGSVLQEGTYEDHKLNGTYISYLGKKKLISNYIDGIYVSGENNMNYGSYFVYLINIDSGYKRVYHAGNLKGIRYEQYLDEGQKKLSTKYYGKEGLYIGEYIETNNSKRTGIEAFYSYKPFVLTSIQYHSKRGEFLGKSVYYKNGSLREKFVQKPNYKTIYFNTKGEEIGSVTYSLTNSYLKVKEGVKYTFVSDYNLRKEASDNEEAWPKSIVTYEDGKIVKSEQKYKNQRIKALFVYKDGYKDLDIFYDEKGNERARLTYKNYKPYEGIQFGLDFEETYKGGTLVERVKHYPNTKTKFMVLKNATETYYDLEGKVLSKLTLNEDNYNSPIDGSRYSYYNGVYERIEEFKNGKKIKLTTLKKGEENVYFKSIEEYDNLGYTKVREIKFYSNNKVQSDITYKKYNPTKGIFYSMTGEKIGAYDYVLKEGKRYLFFYNSDQIEEIEEIKNGKIVRNVKYTKVYDYELKKNKYKIIIDLDSAKEAKYYDKEGTLLAKSIFKDGELYNGSVYKHKDKILYHLKEGKKNGLFEKYDYYGKVIEKGTFRNDLKDGLFVIFNSSGAKMSSINYVKGNPEGDAIYYNGSGEVLSKMTYRDAKPYVGKITNYNDYDGSYKEETYADGRMVQFIDSKKERKIITTFVSKSSKEVVKYNAEGKKFLMYNLNNEKLDGRVISYDTRGDILRTAEFEKGNLIRGKIRLKSLSHSDKESYMFLTRTDTTLAVEKYNADGLEYKAYEKIEIGMRSQHIYKLESRIGYVYPADIE